MSKEELKAQNSVEEGNQLEAVTKLLREQLEIKDCKWYLTAYKICFVESDAVSLPVSSGVARTREQAVELENLILAVNVFYHVIKDQSFKDDNLHYRFVMDEISHGEKEKRMRPRKTGAGEIGSRAVSNRETNQFASQSQRTVVGNAKLTELLDNVHQSSGFPLSQRANATLSSLIF
ncbi:hypothetical protein RFI_37031 [Reticulomyxa filosa]|uniref:DEP domain-containing protein n=1 Tax=Reticulomyxa filosa TaxID=46433 RepID=X6LGF1_RETFI|nr:hypothetical protein RFI_37031 [Reticulomyxa filosa]|eukprot:ETO00416.1 hypothetical protein RFI_37031 [Reticulomyxa filosa]